jgi:hypothetical protein
MVYSIKSTARVGGFLYLVNIVFGFFAIGYVPGVVIKHADAATTAGNILGHELLYRMGLAAHALILLTNIPLAIVFYRLFKIVSRNISLLVVFFTLVGTSVEAASLINQFMPLILLKGNTAFQSFSPGQLQSLAYLGQSLEGAGFNLSLVFFGCYGISIGTLICRSRFLPRAIGVLMIVGGSCYVFNSFASFVAPAFASSLVPYIQLPSGLAELSLCLWLLIAGVNSKKWQEQQEYHNEVSAVRLRTDAVC